MNSITLKGRLTKDPELRYSQGDNPISVTRFSIAVDRRFKKPGQPEADFFNCTAFRKNAELIEKYFAKGQEILLQGSVENRSWEDDNGVKRYATDIIVDMVEFCGKKSDSHGAAASHGENAPTFPGVGENEEDSETLPF